MIYFVFALLLTILCLYFVMRRRQKHVPYIEVEDPQIEDPKVAFRVFDDSLSFVNKKPYFRNQTELWKKEMRSIGDSLRKSQVEHIVFIHGTGVGYDPIGVTSWISDKLPMPTAFLERLLHRLTLRLNGLVLGDLGVFTNLYLDLLDRSFSDRLPCSLFKWTSENNHLARLEASLDLVEYLSNLDLNSRQSKVLLVGHSHAGQIMALVSRFLKEEKFLEVVMNASGKSAHDISRVKVLLGKLEELELRYVTLGAPSRYQWNLNSSHQLLNIVNHRGKQYTAGRFRGLLQTEGGDYIQQFGIEGSDFIPFRKDKRSVLKSLDHILDRGTCHRTLKTRLKLKQRVANYGHTILVDYRDNSKSFFNFIRTGLGHGVYTKRKYLLFNFQIISEHLTKQISEN